MGVCLGSSPLHSFKKEKQRLFHAVFDLAEDNALHFVLRSYVHPAPFAGFSSLSHFPADRSALWENPHGTFTDCFAVCRPAPGLAVLGQ